MSGGEEYMEFERKERAEMTEEEIEVGGATSELIKGGNVLRIRWVTGKTSAGRLFGRYGKEGRPDFFRLLFGAIAGSLKAQFPEEKANELFDKIRASPAFKSSVSEIFDAMKRWFFDEVVPKYKLERGDIFIIITTLELDLETGALKWNKEDTQIVYWVRSDRVPEKCKELGLETGSEDVERLRRERDELASRVRELEERVSELEHENAKLRNEVESLRRENDDLRRKLEEVKQLLGLK